MFIYYSSKKSIIKNEVIALDTKKTYKLTGIVVLILGFLFFLRDVDPDRLNFIGGTSGWTIVIVLIGVTLLAGEVTLSTSQTKTGKQK